MEKDYLIKKWLTNDLTKAEQKAFESLEDYDLHIDIIENARYFKASHFSKADGFEKLDERLVNASPVKKINWIRPLMRIASVFIVGIGIYFLFFFNSLTHIETIASEKTTIELPDSSSITLNALSKISYNKSRWNSNREVKLDGEAFFKVAKGEVFDVVTSDGTVSVLGTQFNVKQRENYFEVVCYEGIVQVTSGENTKKLLAGDTFRIHDDIFSFSSTSFQYPQWTDNISNFKSVQFSEVIEELERQYNITVQFNNPKLNQLFTGGFVHNDLDNALRSISEPLGLTYKIESSNQVRLLDREQ